MAESEKPNFKLNLLVDTENNKVISAESGKDFANVLFSFLALPMGTIVRLLEKTCHRNATIGCFNNLYKSVSDLSTDHFMSQACKDMVLYPSLLKEKLWKQHHLYFDDDANANANANLFRCPDEYEESDVPEDEDGCCAEPLENPSALFLITDELKVTYSTLSSVLDMFLRLGCERPGDLEKRRVILNPNEVPSLLHGLFFSESPLSDVLLKKHSYLDMSRSPDDLQDGEPETNEVVSLTLFVRKQDGKVVYAESGKDFVDLLLTFLLLPLGHVSEMTRSNFERIDNLCESFKSLSSDQGRSDKCMLPWYYSCQHPLLDVSYGKHDYKIIKKRKLEDFKMSSCTRKLIDPRSGKIAGSEGCSGFVKSGTRFMVSDDLVITPMNLSSESNMDLDDIEEQVINISKPEAIRLLRASLMTFSALTSAFGSFLPKKL